MKIKLAEKLLATIMNWELDVLKKERPILQALSNLKYDEYQQFSPGKNFIESLITWLSQFENTEDKKVAYNLLKEHLIYISNTEILHLVNITFPDYLDKILINKVAIDLGYSSYKIKKIISHSKYKEIRRKSLFIGLSDGSHIGHFRRFNPFLSNEQIYGTYQISEARTNDMLKKLAQDSDKEGTKFQLIFLLDDFTASGISYCRQRDGEITGKIIKFLNSIFDTKKHMYRLVDHQKLAIHLQFYIATQTAINHIKQIVAKWAKINDKNIELTINATLILRDEIKEKLKQESSIISFLENYYDNSIENKHYKQGEYTEPHLGFNNSGLPLILNHNTPNNSLPILWFEESRTYSGLFPRVNRHK